MQEPHIQSSASYSPICTFRSKPWNNCKRSSPCALRGVAKRESKKEREVHNTSAAAITIPQPSGCGYFIELLCEVEITMSIFQACDEHWIKISVRVWTVLSISSPPRSQSPATPRALSPGPNLSLWNPFRRNYLELSLLLNRKQASANSSLSRQGCSGRSTFSTSQESLQAVL